jgi:hypothetical protein
MGVMPKVIDDRGYTESAARPESLPLRRFKSKTENMADDFKKDAALQGLNVEIERD